MTFAFYSAEHRYELHGHTVPSVSEIIAPLVDYSMVPEERLNFARDRGTAVHAACHLDDIDDLDESTVDAEHVLPYLIAWRKFKRDHNPAIELSEEPLYHEGLRFAGTPDKWMVINGARIGGDLKTVAQMSPVTGVQLSGYQLLVKDRKGWGARERWGIQLRKDGSYRVTKYPDETATFLSLLNLYNWRKKHA